MPSTTEIEALDNIAAVLTGIATTLALSPPALNSIKSAIDSQTSSIVNSENKADRNIHAANEILVSIQRSLNELHYDARPLVLLWEFWEQYSAHISELLSPVHTSYEVYKNGLATKGPYYAEIVANKNLALDRAVPMSALTLTSVYTGSVLDNAILVIPDALLIGTITNNSSDTLTVLTVAPGPGCSVSHANNSVTLTPLLSSGNVHFVYTVISTSGTSISGIANILITPHSQ